MSNPLTYTDIANMALDWCGGAMSIHDIDDSNNPDAVLCKRNLRIAIRSELEKFEWAFARKRMNVTEVTEGDKLIPGYHCYELPSDFARLSMYTFFDDVRDATSEYTIGHGYFVQDEHLYSKWPVSVLKYNSNWINITKWPTLFCDMIALNLAQRIAPKIKGMDADVLFFEKLYHQKLKDARRLELIATEATFPGMSVLQYQRTV
jgi:hypothetical protein